jgi:hypothetical protein
VPLQQYHLRRFISLLRSSQFCTNLVYLLLSCSFARAVLLPVLVRLVIRACVATGQRAWVAVLRAVAPGKQAAHQHTRAAGTHTTRTFERGACLPAHTVRSSPRHSVQSPAARISPSPAAANVLCCGCVVDACVVACGSSCVPPSSRRPGSVVPVCLHEPRQCTGERRHPSCAPLFRRRSDGTGGSLRSGQSD